MQCEWYIGKRKKGHRCEAASGWVHQSGWFLCDEHKIMLLDSYNEDFRRQDAPKWKPIKNPNPQPKGR